MSSSDFPGYLSRLLLQSLSDSIAGPGTSPDWKCELLADSDMAREEEFFMLTISSYDLRIYTLLQFTRNEQTRQYVARALQLPANELGEDRFYDFVGEIGNNFCGTIKRELGSTSLHLGMSTPNRLDAKSVDYFNGAKHDFHWHSRISGPDGTSFYGSLYAMLGKDLQVNLPKTRRSGTGDSSCGELELF